MNQPDKPAPPPPPSAKAAAQHVADAHRLLQGLRERVHEHPELDEAIEQLEMALSALTVNSGGML